MIVGNDSKSKAQVRNFKMVSETTHPAVVPGALDDRAFASEGAFGSSLANFFCIGAACNFGIGQIHRGPRGDFAVEA